MFECLEARSTKRFNTPWCKGQVRCGTPVRAEPARGAERGLDFYAWIGVLLSHGARETGGQLGGSGPRTCPGLRFRAWVSQGAPLRTWQWWWRRGRVSPSALSPSSAASTSGGVARATAGRAGGPGERRALRVPTTPRRGAVARPTPGAERQRSRRACKGPERAVQAAGRMGTRRPARPRLHTCHARLSPARHASGPRDEGALLLQASAYEGRASRAGHPSNVCIKGGSKPSSRDLLSVLHHVLRIRFSTPSARARPWACPAPPPSLAIKKHPRGTLARHRAAAPHQAWEECPGPSPMWLLGEKAASSSDSIVGPGRCVWPFWRGIPHATGRPPRGGRPDSNSASDAAGELSLGTQLRRASREDRRYPPDRLGSQGSGGGESSSGAAGGWNAHDLRNPRSTLGTPLASGCSFKALRGRWHSYRAPPGFLEMRGH